MTQVAERLQPWLAAIEQRPHGGPRWLQDLRDRGASRFAALGFPTVRDEEWRFTNVAPIAAAEFRPARPTRPRAAESDLAGYLYTDARAPRRRRQRPLRRRSCRARSGLPAGVRVGSLATAVTEQAGRRPALSRPACRLRHAGVHRAEHRASRPTALTSTFPTAWCSSSRIHLLFVTTASAASGRSMTQSARADRGRRATARRGSSRRTSARAAQRISPTR